MIFEESAAGFTSQRTSVHGSDFGGSTEVYEKFIGVPVRVRGGLEYAGFSAKFYFAPAFGHLITYYKGLPPNFGVSSYWLKLPTCAPFVSSQRTLEITCDEVYQKSAGPPNSPLTNNSAADWHNPGRTFVLEESGGPNPSRDRSGSGFRGLRSGPIFI